MRLLVTGSAGFIGSRLVPRLLAQGGRVLGFDDLSLGQPAPLAADAFAFQQGDVRDAAAVRAAFERFRPTHLVHLAALHHIPTCDAEPVRAVDVNVVGTQVLLDAAQDVECGRVVFASSGAVYDWCDGPLTPGRTPLRPRDMYSVSKVANEHQLAVWQEKTGGTVAVARVFNVVGPHDRNGHLIPAIVAQIDRARGRCTVRLGNTTTRRDYVYVDDVAEALARMTTADLAAGLHTFNVGGGSEYSVADLVERVAAIAGVQCDIVADPARRRVVDRPGQLADISATTERLGWRPQTAIDDALRRTLAGV
jgi:UDP-glucose 4-epimerase